MLRLGSGWRGQLGWKILLMATIEAQRTSPTAQEHFKNFTYVPVTDIPLAEVSHMAEPKSQGFPLVR